MLFRSLSLSLSLSLSYFSLCFSKTAQLGPQPASRAGARCSTVVALHSAYQRRPGPLRLCRRRHCLSPHLARTRPRLFSPTRSLWRGRAHARRGPSRRRRRDLGRWPGRRVSGRQAGRPALWACRNRPGPRARRRLHGGAAPGLRRARARARNGFSRPGQLRPRRLGGLSAPLLLRVAPSCAVQPIVF